MEPTRDRQWRIGNSNADFDGNKRKAVENGVFGSLEPSLWPSSPNYPEVEMTNMPLFGRTISLSNHHYALNPSLGNTKKVKPNENHTFLSHPYGDETLVNPQNPETSNSFISFSSLYNKPEENTHVPNLNNISFGTYSDQTQQIETISSSPNIVQFGQTSATKHEKGKDPKPTKKPSSNNFPSNVKSLLSTGMLDGVPVKYVSWSREVGETWMEPINKTDNAFLFWQKSLVGSIQGTGYLCGCLECKFEKSLNAYEFERHANCKTKHPNNHIYFENGKTIYAVVQELKNTPQEMLFDVIQTVTGSTINIKNFNLWKASYQAATRELQRIYGKDEMKRD